MAIRVSATVATRSHITSLLQFARVNPTRCGAIGLEARLMLSWARRDEMMMPVVSEHYWNWLPTREDAAK